VPAVTTNHDDAEFAGIDGYIAEQLGQAAATLAGQASTRARLEEVLRGHGDDRTHSGAVDVSRDG
jgi:hypothetical protein